MVFLWFFMVFMWCLHGVDMFFIWFLYVLMCINGPHGCI